MSSRGLLVVSVVVGVAALLVFGPLLRSPWLWDDKSLILDSPVLKDRAQWSAALASDFWALSANPREAGMYRPVVVASYFADRAVFGTSPVGPHAVNLLLHLLCAALVGLLASRLAASVEVSLLSAALFVFHPATIEAVANVSSRGDLLATLFVLLALLAARSTAAWSLPAVFGCVTLAQLSKESAFVAAPLLLLVDWTANGFERRATRWRPLMAAMGATLLTLLLRFLALGAAFPPGELHDEWHPVLTAASTVVRYAKLVLLPSPLVPYASKTVASWLAVPLLGLAVLLSRPVTWLRFAVVWFLVATAPVAMWGPVTVRFSGLLLYLPLVGVALALARARQRSAMVWLIPVAWAVTSATVVPTWHDDVSLWSSNVEAEPELAAPRLNLANALAATKQPEAAEAYQSAVEVAAKAGDPKSLAMAELGLGNLHLLRAPEVAAEHFAAARAASGGRLWQAGVNLAVAQFLAKNPVEAALTLEAQWNVTPLRPVAEAGFKLGREVNDEAMMKRWNERLTGR